MASWSGLFTGFSSKLEEANSTPAGDSEMEEATLIDPIEVIDEPISEFDQRCAGVSLHVTSM